MEMATSFPSKTHHVSSKKQRSGFVSSKTQPHQKEPISRRVSHNAEECANERRVRKPVYPVDDQKVKPIIVGGTCKESSNSKLASRSNSLQINETTSLSVEIHVHSSKVKPLHKPRGAIESRAVCAGGQVARARPTSGAQEARVRPNMVTTSNHQHERKERMEGAPRCSEFCWKVSVTKVSDVCHKPVKQSKASASREKVVASTSLCQASTARARKQLSQTPGQGITSISAASTRQDRKSSSETARMDCSRENKKPFTAGVSAGTKAAPVRIRERQITPKPQAATNWPCDSTKIPNAPFLKCFKEKVALSQEDICKTSEIVNRLVPEALEEVRNVDPRFVIRMLNTGSYYEHLKVSRPSEFDVVLVFQAHQIERFFKVKCLTRSRESVGYAQLEFLDKATNGRKNWGEFLTQDGKHLSPHKIRSHFYGLLRTAVEAMKRKKCKRVLNLKRNGPAVTLVIDGNLDVDLVLSIEILGWPECANGWGNFATSKTWPTQYQVEQIKMKEPKYHLVAKSCPAEMSSPEHCQKNWRVSFSEAEKALLRPTDPGKKYYRVAKLIFEKHKRDLKPLSSYHLKTLFLRRRREYPRMKSDDSNLGERVVGFLQSLACCLKQGSLWHFFISRLDLFSQISDVEKDNVARKLEICLSKLVGNPGNFLEDLQT